MKKLDQREKRFVEEYILCLSPEQAALTAGYAATTAHTKAYSWVSNGKTKPHVFEAIRVAIEKRSKKANIDAEYVLKRLVEIDELDVADILKDDLMSFKPLSDWPKSWRNSISGFDVTELFEGKGTEKERIGFLKKIKWPDKTRNLELLGKHTNVQAFLEKKEIDLGDNTIKTLKDIFKDIDGSSRGLPNDQGS